MAGKAASQTVRLTLHLQDDVDGAILKEAVEATRQRYPYHQVQSEGQIANFLCLIKVIC